MTTMSSNLAKWRYELCQYVMKSSTVNSEYVTKERAGANKGEVLHFIEVTSKHACGPHQLALTVPHPVRPVGAVEMHA